VRRSIVYLAIGGLAIALGLGFYLVDPFAPRTGLDVPKPSELEAFDDDQKNPLAVLFVGNSFTYVGGVPLSFATLAAAGAPDHGLKIRMATFPNAMLAEHEKRGETVSAIASGGPWTYVVLQDQSSLPRNAPEATRTAIAHLDTLVRQAGARSLLYMTWSDVGEPPASQEAIAGVYESIGKALSIRVAPVGRAWQAAGALRPKLYAVDGHHPSDLGAYFAACVIFASITHKTPSGLPYRRDLSVGDESAAIAELQRIAFVTAEAEP
jgi:hypothetical protein